MSYDVGNYPVSTMFSYELVADGNYHTVEILAIKKNFTLRVDGGLARSIVNEGPNEFLNVRSPLYIAGVPEDAGTKAWKQWHLRNTTSFIGKINYSLTCSFPDNLNCADFKRNKLICIHATSLLFQGVSKRWSSTTNCQTSFKPPESGIKCHQAAASIKTRMTRPQLILVMITNA